MGVANPTIHSVAAAATPPRGSFLSNEAGYYGDFFDQSFVEWILPDVVIPYAEYVEALDPIWVHQFGDASAQFFDFPDTGYAAVGVNGIYGCTSVIIVSEKGIYISHIWENPVFIDEHYTPTDDSTFLSRAFIALRDGTQNAASISELAGTDEDPGPLHSTHIPKVFVVTPYTTDWDRETLNINTNLRYEARAQELAQQVARILPGSGGIGLTLGYERTDRGRSTQVPGTAGRAILEVAPFQYRLTTPYAPLHRGLQIGRWRL